ncbi:MAG: hypothetical protein Fur0019_06020 [Tibeticola sp.]
MEQGYGVALRERLLGNVPTEKARAAEDEDLHGRGQSKATLNKSPRWRAPDRGMGCEAQTASLPAAMARICNEADRPQPGCAAREGLVQRCPNPRRSGKPEKTRQNA